jgi:hypothetical protein
VAKEWTAVGGLVGWLMKDEVHVRAFEGTEMSLRSTHDPQLDLEH